MPKVSVIIPVYNVEEYLEECLDSVCNQTLTDLQIVCVNDGSKDNSLAILKRYAQKDKRIDIIDSKNYGVSHARNLGLTRARGEYCYFFDSDDVLELNACELLYSICKQDNLDILYFGARSFYETKELEDLKPDYKTYYNRTHPTKELKSGVELFIYLNKNRAFRVSLPLQFLNRSFLVQHKFKFVEGIIHEDELFAIEAILEASKAKCIDDILYNRRVRDGSIMTNKLSVNNFNGQFKAMVGLLYLALHYQDNLELQNELAIRVKVLLEATKTTYRALDAEERKKILTKEKRLILKLLYTNFNYPTMLPIQEAAQFKGEKDILQLLEEKTRLIQEINNIYASKSFKIGRAVTYIPRKIRGGIQCYKDNGLSYTMDRMLDHLSLTKLNNIKSKLSSSNISNCTFNKPVFSIVIPVYNVENYLKQCLDSILNQTLNKSGYEIICVDDGSTDNSLNILKDYEKSNKNIKVLTQKNQYAGTARNLGLQYTTGQYVIFMDSDDFIDKKMLEEAYLKINKHSPDIVIVGANIYDMETNQYQKAPWLFRTQYMPKQEVFSINDIPNHIFNICTGTPWNKFFKKSFLESKHIDFPPFRSSNDLSFIFPMIAAAKSICVVDKPLYHLRRGHENNLSATKDLSGLVFFDSFRLFQNRLHSFGVYEKSKKSFINVMLTSCMYELSNIKNPELKKKAHKKFMEEYRYLFELYGQPQNYFYDPGRYQEYINLTQTYQF
ncbi:MAG: hypothetical protein BEN18_02175 [Epulopiscium sp. Nuni2H_MBin001]|nr:MAG: hypothetical protein BEN18_02175 [Epulopiscium sp. Nuni2H_MBin001]